MISIARTTNRNVTRWRDGHMDLRWTAAGMLNAERSFRRIKGFKQIRQLTAAPAPTRLPRQIHETRDMLAPADGVSDATWAMLAGVDVLLAAERQVGDDFGHATVDDTVVVAEVAEVGVLVLFHHSPAGTDALDHIGANLVARMPVLVAREGATIEFPAGESCRGSVTGSRQPLARLVVGCSTVVPTPVSGS